MRELPRGTVTLLFTDIEGSTRLLHELGDAYADVLAEHRRVLREAFGQHGGVEVDTQGDAFFYAFERAHDAVAAAAAAQEALGDGPVRVRMGVHTGEPLVTAEGYVGLEVHRAARLMSAGHGGQLLISQTTRELLGDDLHLRDLGERRLKDLSRPLRIYQHGAREFPPLKTLDMTNLPIAASPLLGRRLELQNALSLLRDGTRLLTVTGPGGTGKTRFALQLAAELVDVHKDGVFWVPLAELSDPELVMPAIGHSVGARGDLAEHIREKELLVLLDNAEHLLAFAPMLAHVLSVSPRSHFLVTSRAPLHLAGEYEFPLDPLPPSDAVTLFVERARATGTRIAPDEDVDAVCLRLDGLPLAIELAAARAKILTPKDLRSRLERALPLLVGGSRDAPERQQTLRATIQWSYDLLSPEARPLFNRLSVFDGDFSLDAAEEVCDAELDDVFALVDNSILKSIGESRFLMLETIRQFAGEQLDDPARTDEVRSRHANYFLKLAVRAEPHLRGPDQREWLDRLELENAQLRSALTFLWKRDDHEQLAEFASALVHFWFVRGYLAEGQIWLDRAVQRLLGSNPLRPKVLGDVAFFAALQGATEAAQAFADEGVIAARHHRDLEAEAACLQVQSIVAHMRGLQDQAYVLAAQSLDLRRTAGAPRAIAVAVGNLGTMAAEQKNYAEARALFEESAQFFREFGEHEGMSFSLASLGQVNFLDGRVDEAGSQFAEALAHALDAQHQLGIMYCFEGLAAVLCRHEPERAATLLGAADALSTRLGAFRGEGDEDLVFATSSASRERLGDAHFDAARARGAAMSVAEAVEVARGSLD